MISVILANSITLIKVAAFIILIFVVLPLLIIKPEKGKLIERVGKGFGITAFSCILVTYFLALFRMYELFSFVVLFLPVVVLIYFWVEGKSLKELKLKEKLINLAVFMFNKIEKCRTKNDEEGFKKEWLKSGKKSYGNIIFIGSAVLVFLYMLYLRLIEIMPRVIIYYSDSYGHLMITKLLVASRFITEKFYPIGFHSIISATKTISFCDYTDIIRFIGPIQSVIIIFSVFWFVFMVTRNKYAALFSAAILGLDSLDILPLIFYRQLVALSQEFGTIFFLPTVYFCMEYVRKRDKKDLKYFFIFLSNVFFTHLYVGMLVFWVIIGVMIAGTIFGYLKRNNFIKVTIAGLLGCILGSVPLIVWTLANIISGMSGKTGGIVADEGFFYNYLNLNIKVEDLIDFLRDAINPIKDIFKWHNQVGADILVYSLLFTLGYLMLRFIFRRKFFKRHLYLLALSIGQLFLIIFHYGFFYHLFSLMFFERIGLILSMCGVTIIGLMFNELFVWIRCFKKNKTYKNLLYYSARASLIFIIVAIIAGMVVFLPYEKPNTAVFQYEGAIKAYYKIKKDNEFLNWTIVSPVEELSLVYGCGLHYEMWEFLQNFNIKNAKNRNFDFGKKIPTQNIYIYVEKEPLLIWYTIPILVTNISETELYYRTYSERKLREEQLANWIKEYRKSHENLANNAEIFYEDNDIIVYHIKHILHSVRK